jgi:hypothetical protein
MKTNSHPQPTTRRSAGYALMIVLIFTAASALVLAATMRRTYVTANLNERNNQMVANLNAAEAAAEKVYARMAYDFASYGIAQVTTNLASYRSGVPNTTEDAYWGNFDFANGQGQVNATYVGFLSNYSGALPSQYPGLWCTSNSQIYRIVSNVRAKNSRYNMTNAVQVDVLLAQVPITTYAIFYNGVLEFSDCATMTINGRVHANGEINVGAGGSSTLTFNGTVTTTDRLYAPDRNGNTWGTAPSGWKTSFNGSPTYSTNVPRVSISMNMTNSHALIDMPTTNDAATTLGQERLYNKAQVILLVSNTSVTMQIQAPISGLVPGRDPSPTILKYTNTTAASLSTNLPFLTLTNKFTDQREGKTILATQIDVGRYASWAKTNSAIQTKLPSSSSIYPTILYVADNRSNTSTNLSAIRITNGVAPPVNGGLGFTVATPNPLYVWGHYNATNNLGSTNTSTALPCALMSDALTLLSPNWQDSASGSTYSSSGGVRNAANMTVNAAILTGAVPSTGSSKTDFSGGVHNLTRLLENWTGDVLTLNTSILNLFNSQKATSQWKYQGTYYNPPTRNWSFDNNFMNPAKQPPGIPAVLVPIRYGWTEPPPNNVTYNVTP